MESNVFSNPDIAILNGGKFFEDLISDVMITESISEEKTVNDNINKLKDYNVIDYEMKNTFHQARIARNQGVHDNPDKNAFRLCALLFRISVWFYDKYSGDSNFKKPSFDRNLIVEKDKETNKNSGSAGSTGFDKEDMRGLLEDVIDEKMRDFINNMGNNSSGSEVPAENNQTVDNEQNSSDEIDDTLKETHMDDNELNVSDESDDDNVNLSKTNGN